MNNHKTEMEKEKKKIDYLCQAINKIQCVVQDLFDKQNHEQLDNLEFYFYCIGNDIYYHIHRYEYIFNDRLDLRDLWCKRYENLHDSVELICPILKESGQILSSKFDKINQEIYLFIIVSEEVKEYLNKLLLINGSMKNI